WGYGRPNEREVFMRASESTAVFGRSPWPQPPALTQFHSDRDLTRDTLSKLRIRISHSSRSEANRYEPRQPKLHSGRFASSRHIFFCWKGTSQCPLEVVLWKSSRRCLNVQVSWSASRN